jgi:AcrR family transcriptional regulator
MVNLVDGTTPKRRYHSPQSQLQAQLTRRKLLDAARRLFAARGYVATTLPDIAREAGMSAPTIAAVFGPKARLLTELIHLVVGGEEEPIPLVERPWWQAMLAEPDAHRQLTLFAANGRQIHERSADIAEIMREAAVAAPEIAAVLRQLAEGRLRDARIVAALLQSKGALAADVSVEQAADILWALGLHDRYRMLLIERGWSARQYEQWFASSLIHSVLESSDVD